MKQPKVLIGVPIKGDPKLQFVMGLMECMRLSDADYIVSFCPSTYVQAGRNQLVEEARKLGCDELIFIDSDMGIRPEHILRLRSHDVDIVGGVYPKRVSGEPQLTCHATGEPHQGDLVPCNDVATGLLRIKMRVFDRLDEAFPMRRYQNGDDLTLRTEYFPMALTVGAGWQHPSEVKLEAISAILEGARNPGECGDAMADIMAVIAKETPPVHIVGEDVSFCRLAKHAGFTVWADLGCLVRHIGDASYPLVETNL